MARIVSTTQSLQSEDKDAQIQESLRIAEGAIRQVKLKWLAIGWVLGCPIGALFARQSFLSFDNVSVGVRVFLAIIGFCLILATFCGLCLLIYRVESPERAAIEKDSQPTTSEVN